MPPPKYDTLDWASIRREYEQTDISVKALTAKHNVKSRFTIQKKITRESWTRNTDGITARLVTAKIAAAGRAEALAERAPPPAPSPPAAPAPAAPPTPRAPARKVSGLTDKIGALAEDTFTVPRGIILPKRAKGDTGGAIGGATGGATGGAIGGATRTDPLADDDGTPKYMIPGGGGASGPVARAEISLEAAVRHIEASGDPDPDADSDVAMARGVAHLHATAIYRQMGLGREVQSIGMRVLRAIDLLVASNDANLAMEAYRRLMAANPDKETIQALLKVAVWAVDQGMLMERRALVMDAVKGGHPGEVAPLTLAGGESAIAVVRKIDPALALRLRAVAKDVAAARSHGGPIIDAEKELT